MNTIKRLITIRFVIVLACWQVIGVASMIFSPLIYLYLGVIPLLAWALLQDKKNLAPASAFHASIKGAETLRLEGHVSWFYHIQLKQPFPASKRMLFFSSSSLFTSDQVTIKLKKHPLSWEWEVVQHVQGVALGGEDIRSLTLIVTSPLGWWQAIYQIMLEDVFTFQVKPSLQPLPEERLTHSLRHIYHLLVGSRVAMRSRSPEQFHSIRRYRYPDDVRFVDAKKTARYQKLMVREYESLTQHQLVIALDLGRSLMGTLGTSLKKDFYLEAVLTLYQSALEFQDKVSFFAFHQDLIHISKGKKGLQEIHQLLQEGGKLQAKDLESNYELIPGTLQRLTHQRSIVLVLSDINRPSVQDSLRQSLSLVSRQHLSLSIGILEEKFRIEAKVSPKTNTHEWAHDLYRFWLEDEFEKYAKSLSRIGSGAILCPERHWLDLNRKVYQLLRHSLRA
ncbi:MAG: DUF58 domain-containing protein [Oligoflexus sp.]